MLTQVNIYNMALAHLGISVQVSATDELTASAKACRLFYDVSREEVLRDAPWPFATVYEILSAVTNPVPAGEFLFAYQYPANSLNFRRILNGIARVEDRQSQIKYKIVRGSSGRIILCDIEADVGNDIPTGVYTHNETDTGRFPPDFAYALSLKLAVGIGPSLAADKTKLVDRTLGLYWQSIAKARVNAFNEEADDEEVNSEFERVRDS